MRQTWIRIGVLIAVFCALVVPSWAQPFTNPSWVNPADTDLGADRDPCQVAMGGTVYVVWSSNSDYTGLGGTDRDIYFSENPGTGWSSPQLVNNYGNSDACADEHPKLALDANGDLHCVWQSNQTGDLDIVYATRSFGVWSTAHFLNDAMSDAGRQDEFPGIAIEPGGRIVVCWSSDFPYPSGGPVGGIGTDYDILWSSCVSSVWSAPAPLHDHFAADSGQDIGPVAMTTGEDGLVLAAWASNDPLRPVEGKGTDYDIVYSTLLPGGWTAPTEVCAAARTDTGTDTWPSVVSIGTSADSEVHVVWQSNEDLLGSGLDYDIAHTVIPAYGLFPPMNPVYLVNSSATTDGAADDLHPSLTVEPGGVLHCAWESNYDWDGRTGSDFDVFHSLNATHVGGWSPMRPLSSNAYSDGPGEDDTYPNIIFTPGYQLKAVWSSTDDLGFTIGGEGDILTVSGMAKQFSRPDWINTSAPFDGVTANDEEARLAVGPDNTLHAVWESCNPDLAGGGLGYDFDIFHAVLGPNGWSDPEVVNTNAAFDAGNDYSPDIAILPGGALIVVWESWDDLGGTLGTDGDILFSANPGTGWTPPQAVNSYASTDSKGDTSPRVVAAADGTVRCVWQAETDTLAHTSNICFSMLGPSGFTPAQYVNATFHNPPAGWNEHPVLALDGEGVPVVAWASEVDYAGAGTDLDIFASRQTGGLWSAPQFVNGAVGDSAQDRRPTLCRAPDGVIHCIWDADLDIDGAGTDRDLFHSQLGPAGWSTPHLLFSWGAVDAGPDDSAAAAYDASGTLHVVWHSTVNLYDSGLDDDLHYSTVSWGSALPAASWFFLANTSGFADGSSEYDVQPAIAMDHNGRLHAGWHGNCTLGGVLGGDVEAFHAWMDLSTKWAPGPPYLESVSDNNGGSLILGWGNLNMNAAQYLGFAWDIYAGQWVLGGYLNTLWHPYPAGSFSGVLPLGLTGGYHAWISNQYSNGGWYACGNPWTGILYSGTPHTPRNFTAANLGSHAVRLSWSPEIYGTWHCQVIAYKVGTGWVNTLGPCGDSMWQFVYYPLATFLNGSVDLTVPSAGDYWFYLRFAGWLPPYPTGEYATAFVHAS
ncbi:MAG: hypothetical protein NTW86_09465 [Candidatus Sumerlaeota bacterium]|nr:hypothetical protein [Candidatus Sumerlaeota bacterium]